MIEMIRAGLEGRSLRDVLRLYLLNLSTLLPLVIILCLVFGEGSLFRVIPPLMLLFVGLQYFIVYRKYSFSQTLINFSKIIIAFFREVLSPHVVDIPRASIRVAQIVFVGLCLVCMIYLSALLRGRFNASRPMRDVHLYYVLDRSLSVSNDQRQVVAGSIEKAVREAKTLKISIAVPGHNGRYEFEEFDLGTISGNRMQVLEGRKRREEEIEKIKQKAEFVLDSIPSSKSSNIFIGLQQVVSGLRSEISEDRTVYVFVDSHLNDEFVTFMERARDAWNIEKYEMYRRIYNEGIRVTFCLIGKHSENAEKNTQLWKSIFTRPDLVTFDAECSNE